MNSLLESLSEFGLIGVFIGYLIYQNFITNRKLFSIIEHNTEAFIELKNTIHQFINGKK